MKRPNVKNEVIAQILFEVFLMVLPVERRDIHFAADRYRVEREPIAEGAKFVAIYDQTYGSLRLSARIMDERTIHGILEKMAVIMKLRWEDGSLEEDSETAAALGEILACLSETPEIITIGAMSSLAETAGHLVRVILPGSKGLNLRSNNEEFVVENVFYSPHYRGPAYRGYGCEGAVGVTHDVKTIVALASLLEIPGESKIGWYDPESGELNNEPVRLN
jgi:DEAD/DEAH box helicase domain-containing protein